MITMSVNTWTEYKNLIALKQLKIQYIETSTQYELFASEYNSFVWNMVLLKDQGSDVTDFENNYKASSNQKLEDVDTEGRKVQRIAASNRGWTYLADTFELETSNLTGLYAKDYLGNDNSAVTVKFFDVNNNELTTQQDIDTSCVKTELLFKPSYDYEVVGGNIRQISSPSDDVRLWVVGGIIDLGSSYVKEMVRSLNLKYVSANDHLDTDGRAAKFMKKEITGVQYQGNQLKFVFRHPAGVKHKVMIVLEYFRA